MMTIGKFIKNEDGNFSGNIRTLCIKADKVVLTQVQEKSEKGPDYKLVANGTKIGAAWIKTSKAGNEYISVTLDDPSFAEPIFAVLQARKEGQFDLVWSRPSK